jgi:hypothetical protein
MVKLLKELLEELGELKKNPAWGSSESYKRNQKQFLLEKYAKRISEVTQRSKDENEKRNTEHADQKMA